MSKALFDVLIDPAHQEIKQRNIGHDTRSIIINLLLIPLTPLSSLPRPRFPTWIGVIRQNLKLVQLETQLIKKILAAFQDLFHIISLLVVEIIFVKVLEALRYNCYGLDPVPSDWHD